METIDGRVVKQESNRPIDIERILKESENADWRLTVECKDIKIRQTKERAKCI